MIYDELLFIIKCSSGTRIYRRAFKYYNMKKSVGLAKGAFIASSCFLLMVSWTAFGQIFKPLELPMHSTDMGDITEITIENQGLKDNLNTLDLNTVTLRQMGQENQATIMQFSNSSDPNLVAIDQNGHLNSANLLQSGRGNAAEITQIGDMNSFDGIHFGDGIVSSVMQDGNENVVRQFLYGNDMDFQIIQDGNRNVVNQIQTGSGIGYKVTQTGDDMKVTVIQDHVMRW